MIEIAAGVMIGLGFAILFPELFTKLREKIVSIIDKDHDCKK